MRLVVGCGPRHPKAPDEFLIDRLPFPGVDKVWDLDICPWPVPDNSCLSITAVHVVEHLTSLLVPFMNECWRILQPGGLLYLVTPLAGANPDLEWCDPTHIRCYRRHSFINYFTPGGIERFGYTRLAWEFPELSVNHLQELIVRGHPLKT